jgi:glycosyltransferase involved in cell wall biosynthesis
MPQVAAPLVVIPAYNEQDALPGTLAELGTAAPELDVLVVDDGSTDATAGCAALASARVVRLPFNLGVGGAVRAGLRFAADRGYTRVVIVDADGQHDPADIRVLLAELDGGADVVIGSRFAPGAPPYAVGWLRRRGMRLLARIVHRLVGAPLTDVTSGFRAFDRAAVELLARDYPVEYLADTVEVLLRCHAAGLTLREVPVGMRRRAAGAATTRTWRLAMNYLRLLIGIASWGWRSSRPGTPLPREGTE